MKVIGHRGARGEMPENTLAAIRHGLQFASGIEIDVQMSKDQQLVVIHDNFLDRTTNGKGMVSEMAYEEIRRLDAGAGERIPILEEVMDAVKNAGKEIFIEIKCHGAEESVAQLIAKKGMIENSVVKSFDHRIVKKIKQINPKIRTGCLLACRPIDVLQMVENADADMASIMHAYADEDLIRECHTKKKIIYVWNVNDKETLLRFRKLGVDYIGTDFPSAIN